MSKFTFVSIKAEYLKSHPPYWALKVETIKDLFYYLEVQSPKIIKGYFDLKRRIREGYHVVGDIEEMLNTIFIAEELQDDEKRKVRETCIDDLKLVSDLYTKPKLDAIFKRAILLINQTGLGYCHYNPKLHTILETITSDKYIFPDEKETIKIDRWEGGSHWYVRVGEYDLPDKYIDYDTAKRAGALYLKNQKVKI